MFTWFLNNTPRTYIQAIFQSQNRLSKLSLPEEFLFSDTKAFADELIRHMNRNQLSMFKCNTMNGKPLLFNRDRLSENIEDGEGMLQCHLSKNTLDDIFAKYSKVQINLWGGVQTHIVASICNFNARLPDYNVNS